MNDDPRTWDLNAAVIDGDSAEVALIEAIRRYGASEVEFGFRWNPAWGPDPGPDGDPPPGEPVTWYATARFPTVFGRTRVVTMNAIAGPSTGFGHRRAAVEALRLIVRELGGTVEVVNL